MAMLAELTNKQIMKTFVLRLLAWGGVTAITLLPFAAPAADQNNHGRQRSGISGQAVISPNVTIDGIIFGGSPVETRVAVYSIKGRLRERLVGTFKTDAEGNFEVALEPGSYVLVPCGLSNPYLYPVHTPVTVHGGDVTTVAFGYYDPPLGCDENTMKTVRV